MPIIKEAEDSPIKQWLISLKDYQIQHPGGIHLHPTDLSGMYLWRGQQESTVQHQHGQTLHTSHNCVLVQLHPMAIVHGCTNAECYLRYAPTVGAMTTKVVDSNPGGKQKRRYTLTVAVVRRAVTRGGLNIYGISIAYMRIVPPASGKNIPV